MRVLVVTIAPIYWALAGESGDALNGYSLTGGSFRQESHMEFASGEWGLPRGGPGGVGLSPGPLPGGDSRLDGDGLQGSCSR